MHAACNTNMNKHMTDKVHMRYSATVECSSNAILLIIIIIMFVYYSCSQNATTEPTSVMQDSTDTIERKASIYNQT